MIVSSVLRTLAAVGEQEAAFSSWALWDPAFRVSVWISQISQHEMRSVLRGVSTGLGLF